MATNPRIPSKERIDNRERGPQLVPSQPASKRPSRGVPGVLAGIIVAIALITAILYFIPRLPKRTLLPSAAQASGSQLQFTETHITPAPTGGAVSLDGQVMNTGGRAILGAMVRLSFRDASGAIVGTATSPLEGMTNEGDTLVRDDFSTDSLKPNASRPFRVIVSRTPAGWNHAMPEMKVLTVSAEGNR